GALVQLRASRADIFEQRLVLDDVEELEGHGTSQRAAAKRGPMNPRRDARGHLLGGEYGAQRKAGRERLGNQDNVRSRWELLIAEVAAGAAESALKRSRGQDTGVL